jgi:hypothetical protein
MRLILELRGRRLEFAIEQIVTPESEPVDRGDVFATTERRESYDCDDRVHIGFLTGKRTE